MALVDFPGGGLWVPRYTWITSATFSTLVIDATGEKVAFIGPIWTPNRGAKSIRKVGFRFGAVTKAGGSALTVSLQDVDTANGQPYRPDGTQDQTVAIANADAAFVANTWIQTGNFSADRAVTYGELLAVVVEFDGAGRLGADLVNVTSPTSPSIFHHSNFGLFTASWSFGGGSLPGLILEFSDGTFGTLLDGAPFSAMGTLTYNSTTAVADEHALEFQFPWECKVDACWATLTPAGTASDFDIVMYDGTTPMTNGTISVDAHTMHSTNPLVFSRQFPAPLTLAANTTYRLAIKPTTANNISVQYGDVANASYFGAMNGGTAWRLASRIDGGAWAAAVTTRRPHIGLRLSAVHDGTGSGGPIGPGRLTGGLQ